MRQLIFLAALTVLLAGCGFYLKGQGPAYTALKAVSVTYEQPYRVGDPPLVMALQNRLRARGALAQSNPASRIHITNMRNQQRVLSVSPIDGRAAVFELIAAATFDLNANGKPVIKNQTLSVHRDYSFDNSERLAAQAEQKDLLADMQSELADLMLLRAETALAAESRRHNDE